MRDAAQLNVSSAAHEIEHSLTDQKSSIQAVQQKNMLIFIKQGKLKK